MYGMLCVWVCMDCCLRVYMESRTLFAEHLHYNKRMFVSGVVKICPPGTNLWPVISTNKIYGSPLLLYVLSCFFPHDRNVKAKDFKPIRYTKQWLGFNHQQWQEPFFFSSNMAIEFTQPHKMGLDNFQNIHGIV